MIGVSVEGDVRRVADKLSALAEVDYVVMCAGSFDILVEIVCEDDERLLQVLNDSVRCIPGVRATETFLYLKLAKQTYTWGAKRPRRKSGRTMTMPNTPAPGERSGWEPPDRGWPMIPHRPRPLT